MDSHGLLYEQGYFIKYFIVHGLGADPIPIIQALVLHLGFQEHYSEERRPSADRQRVGYCSGAIHDPRRSPSQPGSKNNYVVQHEVPKTRV